MKPSPIEPSSSSRRPARLGLRVQILLALAGVMLVAFLPLFFAIAQMTRAMSLAYREDAARGLGRAIAAHVSDVARDRPSDIERTIASHLGEGGASAIAVFDGAGERIAGAGASVLAAPSRPYGEQTHRVGRVLDVTLPSPSGAVVVRVRAEEDRTRTAQVVRGVGLYTLVFALALLVFAYIALTRTIVRPIESLARAADRIASGGRALDMPLGGAREISDLAQSVRSMTARLVGEERALRAKVEELTTTTKRLSETREQLAGSERMASVGRLAAGVAHEIGNPIAAIMGMHDLLEDGDTGDETRVDFLRRMRKETERIHVVVRDLLDYARPENESADGATASVASVVEDVTSLVRVQKEWRSVELSVDVEDDLRVQFSPHRLTQVLLNLALNAGVAVRSHGGGAIRFRARRTGSRVRLEVEDDGPGVKQELRERIFDPFVTTKEVGEGTGLGLAVCRGLVEGAGGRIFLDRDYEGGARFVVDLPSA